MKIDDENVRKWIENNQLILPINESNEINSSNI